MTPNDALLMTPHLWRNVDKNTEEAQWRQNVLQNAQDGTRILI